MTTNVIRDYHRIKPYSVDKYVRWNVNLKKPLESIIYPSVLKKIHKKPEIWSFFNITCVTVTPELYLKNFDPVYQKMVVSKNTYAFEKDYMMKQMHKKLKKENTHLWRFHTK